MKMNKKLNKKRNSVVFSVSLPTEHDDLYRIIERFVHKNIVSCAYMRKLCRKSIFFPLLALLLLI